MSLSRRIFDQNLKCFSSYIFYIYRMSKKNYCPIIWREKDDISYIISLHFSLIWNFSLLPLAPMTPLPIPPFIDVYIIDFHLATIEARERERDIFILCNCYSQGIISWSLRYPPTDLTPVNCQHLTLSPPPFLSSSAPPPPYLPPFSPLLLLLSPSH